MFLSLRDSATLIHFDTVSFPASPLALMGCLGDGNF